MYVNLLDETNKVLAENNKQWCDVRFVRTYRNRFDILDAQKMMNFEYDNGYGTQHVDPSLQLVGDDWWLERYEYDGAECWQFKTIPQDIEVPTCPYPNATFFFD